MGTSEPKSPHPPQSLISFAKPSWLLIGGSHGFLYAIKNPVAGPGFLGVPRASCQGLNRASCSVLQVYQVENKIKPGSTWSQKNALRLHVCKIHVD